MDPRKAALQEFLDFSRDSLTNHMNIAIQNGSISANEAKNTLATFDERRAMVIQAFEKQSGGALPKAPSMPKMDLEKVPSPEEIQKDIDALINFSPADHMPAPIKPVLDTTLQIFVPGVRDKVKQAFGMFFLLGSLDKLPIFGPLIGSSMDIATAFMPALAATFQNMLPNIVGLAPIPYAAFVGEAAGYVFSSVMMFMTLMTQVSRGEFWDALEAGAGLLPVVGTTLMMYVNKGKKVLDKVMDMRQKVVVSLAQMKGLILYVLPMITKKAAALLTKFLPVLDTLLKSAAVYLIGPANIVLDNMKPVLATFEKRLAKIESMQAPVKKGGRRYTKRTRRVKRKHRKSNATRAKRSH